MFCSLCGTNVPDDSAFCPGCGAKIDTPQPTPQQQASVYQQPADYQQQPAYQQPAYQQPAYQQPAYQQPAYQQPAYQQPAYQQPAYQQMPNKPKSSKKWLIALIIGIVAVLAIGILVFVLLNQKNKSPEDVVEQLEKAYNKQNLEYFYDTLPDYYEKELRAEFKDYYDSEEEFWEEVFYYDLYPGPEAFSSISTDFQIVEKEWGDWEDCEELEEEIYDYHNKKISISEACALEIEITYTLKFDNSYLKDMLGSDYKDTMSYEFGTGWEKGITETTYVDAIAYESNGEWFLYYYEAF